ncbi:MAG: phosphopantetheine-binding protein [Myxococcota bacterium]|nr:phosphopantetheine-binding protein [Myxococcota bacterium]
MSEPTSADEVFSVVKENILGLLEDLSESDITLESSLKELGANSLDRADIVTGSMEDLGLSFPMRELAGIGNVGELVTFLHGKVKNA